VSYRLVAVAVLVLSGVSAAADPVVTVTGGADDTGQNYTWTITHDYAFPIVHVEIPQYKSGWHRPPEGWTAEVTHPRGIAGRAGKFIADVDDPSQGIARGGSAEFQLGIVAGGTPRGRGDILVRFADGVEATVRAEVPIKEPARDRNVPLIGLGLIFGIFVLARALRKKRGSPPASAPPAES
jgi:hypothetical protein